MLQANCLSLRLSTAHPSLLLIVYPRILKEGLYGFIKHLSPNDESSTLNSRDDTAKKEDDNEKILEDVDYCQNVVKEKRERHVQILGNLYLK